MDQQKGMYCIRWPKTELKLAKIGRFPMIGIEQGTSALRKASECQTTTVGAQALFTTP